MFQFLAPLFAGGASSLAAKAAVSVGTSLVSGAIASKQQKKNLAFQQAQSNQNEARHADRFSDLVENSQRAGFNPLTALRADGASSYQAPILNAPMATSTFVGNALADGLQTGFNYDQQKRDEERDNLERDIMKAQLDQLQKANKVRGGEYFGYGIPNAQTTTDNSRPAGNKFFDPARREHLKNADGTPYTGVDPIPTLTHYVDENNVVTLGPNPELFDLDQAGSAAIQLGLSNGSKKIEDAKNVRDLWNDWVDKQASAAWKRISTPLPPRLTPSTNPRRPKTFNSRAY